MSVYWKVVSFAMSTARSPLFEVHVRQLPSLGRLALRASNRSPCSSALTENQYSNTTIPERTSIRSNSGQLRRNSGASSSAQNPITHSTFDRLYQLRSNRTISPPMEKAGAGTYRWKYHWLRLWLGRFRKGRRFGRSAGGALAHELDHATLAKQTPGLRR